MAGVSDRYEHHFHEHTVEQYDNLLTLARYLVVNAGKIDAAEHDRDNGPDERPHEREQRHDAGKAFPGRLMPLIRPWNWFSRHCFPFPVSEMPGATGISGAQPRCRGSWRRYRRGASRLFGSA